MFYWGDWVGVVGVHVFIQGFIQIRFFKTKGVRVVKTKCVIHMFLCSALQSLFLYVFHVNVIFALISV